MMEDFSFYHSRFLWLLCQNDNTTNYKADLLESGAQLTPKVTIDRLFRMFCKRTRAKKWFPFTFRSFVFLKLRMAHKDEQRIRLTVSRRSGADGLERPQSLCVSLRATWTKNCALSLPQPWTIPRAEEGPGQVGGVCARGWGNKWSQFSGTVQSK